MYHSRAERYENRTDNTRARTPNDLTFDEVYLWTTYASAERGRYVAGEITADEFLRNIRTEPGARVNESTKTPPPKFGRGVSLHKK